MPNQYRPPPLREKSVQRDALVDRLAQSSARVVVLSGPVGYGKSTLLAQWAARDTRRFVWLRLAQTDNNPRALSQRITAAIATLRFTGTELPPLSGVDRDGRPARIGLAELLDQVATACVVVLDDVHRVTGAAALEVVDVLLEHLPAGSQLAVAGRYPAPLGVRKWRAEYDLLEICTADLAFNPTETRKALVSNTTGADAIHRWCEGWPAAVSLALAAIRAGSCLTPESDTQLAENVGQYLESEILNQLQDAELTFLTRTAILDELSTGACDAVAGEAAAGRTPASVFGGALLIPIESKPGRYRWHPLLRKLLLTRLELREPGLVPVLHQRAAHWFAGAGDLDSALEHAVLADDVDLAGELIWPLVGPSLGAADLDRLQHLLAMLSQVQIGRSTELLVASGWAAMLAGRPAEMDRWLSLTDGATGTAWSTGAQVADHLGALALLRAWSGANDLSDALELSSAAFDALPSQSSWRAAAGALSGLALGWSGQPDAAQQRLRISAALADAHHDQRTHSDALVALGVLDPEHGSRALADQRFAAARDRLAPEYESDSPTSMFTTSVLAEYVARTGTPASAMTILARARVATTAAAGLAPWLRIHSMLRQSTACLLLGDVTSARQLVRAAQRLANQYPVQSSLLGLIATADSALWELPANPGVGFSPLTVAERRILRLLPTYLSYVEMGTLLSVSRHTVKTQALAVYRKLGATSRHEAVERGSAAGFFDPVALPGWPGP